MPPGTSSSDTCCGSNSRLRVELGWALYVSFFGGKEGCVLNEFLRELVKRFAWAFLALLVAQWAFMPGYPALDMPAHSDLWRYYVISHEQSLWSALTSPRPLMLVFLHLLKIISNTDVFYVALNLPAALFVSSLTMALERVWGKVVPTLFVWCYFVVVFSMPTFYELNPLDFGGMLAGCVFSLALYWVCRIGEHHADKNIYLNCLVFGIFSLISVETKPTFAVIFPFLPFVLYGKVSRKNIFLLCLSSAFMIGCSFAKDLIYNSPFIKFSGADTNPYHVGHDPHLIFSALAEYTKYIMPMAWLPIVLFAIWLAVKKNRLMAFAIVVMPLLIIAPMCAIPSRVLPMYSWFATVVLGAMAVNSLQEMSSVWAPRATILAMAVFFAAIVLGNQPNKGVVPWIVANQKFNKDSLDGLRSMAQRVLPNERVLIVGRFMPYSPFQNDQFVRLISPVHFDWSVAYPAASAPFVLMSNDTKSMIPQASVSLSSFDKVAIFSSNGNFERFSPVSDFTAMKTGELEATFYCGRELSISDIGIRSAKVMSCLNDIGEFSASVDYGNAIPLDKRDQWTWFMYGHANEGVKNYVAAYESFKQAYAIEHAAVFQEAMDSALVASRRAGTTKY